jgi:hypothetical protein
MGKMLYQRGGPALRGPRWWGGLYRADGQAPSHSKLKICLFKLPFPKSFAPEAKPMSQAGSPRILGEIAIIDLHKMGQ